MPVPNFSLSDFRQALLGLLPQGAIWPRDPSAMPWQIANVWAPTFQRSADRAANLLIDAFPSTTNELLPEWEETLGLPDPCAGESPTVAQRRNQVLARLSDTGGSSVSDLVQFAATLGYAITITQFAAAAADILVADGPANDPPWAYVWRVNAAQTTVTYFEADQSFADEPLATWGNGVLECEISARAPAHTIVQFSYS